VFARSLSIGAETMVMNFRPRPADARPLRGRRTTSSRRVGDEVVTIGRIVNAFFRWEFNSCETLVAARGAPDRLRERLPGRRDHVAALLLPVGHEGAAAVVGVLHRHRPQPVSHVDPTPWFAIADRDDLSYDEKLAAYDAIADRTSTPSATGLLRVPARRPGRVAVDYFESADFDRVLVDTVTSTFPAHEHDQFVPHYRGLLASWCRDERARLA
jgi:hypothetical protein